MIVVMKVNHKAKAKARGEEKEGENILKANEKKKIEENKEDQGSVTDPDKKERENKINKEEKKNRENKISKEEGEEVAAEANQMKKIEKEDKEKSINRSKKKKSTKPLLSLIMMEKDQHQPCHPKKEERENNSINRKREPILSQSQIIVNMNVIAKRKFP